MNTIKLCYIVDSLEQSIHPQKDAQVYEWILKNEAAVMKESMIAPVRKSAGLKTSADYVEYHENIHAKRSYRLRCYMQLAGLELHVYSISETVTQ